MGLIWLHTTHTNLNHVGNLTFLSLGYQSDQCFLCKVNSEGSEFANKVMNLIMNLILSTKGLIAQTSLALEQGG